MAKTLLELRLRWNRRQQRAERTFQFLEKKFPGLKSSSYFWLAQLKEKKSGVRFKTGVGGGGGERTGRGRWKIEAHVVYDDRESRKQWGQVGE